MSLHHRRSLVLLALALWGCASADDEATPLNDELTSTSTADDPETTGDSSGSTPDDTTGVEPASDVPAADIRISLVEINQGVAVPIAIDQAWVGPADRNAPVLGGRDTLVRVQWELDEGFVPRPIEARFRLVDPSGMETMRKQVLDIDGPSDSTRLDGGFYFDVLAEAAQAGTRFEVALFEAEPGPDVEEPAEPPVAPADGPAIIGFEDGPMELRVHVVPLHAAWPGCSSQPDTSPEVMRAFEDAMRQRTPTTAVELSVAAEPIVLTTAPSSLWDTFVHLQERRVEDGAAPEQYYYGLLNACGAGSIDGAGGMAFGLPTASPDDAYQRVATGLWLPLDLSWSSTTFVHEVGHLQGLAHVECEQPAPNPNPSYPYDSGGIGVWGFGILDFQLRNPEYSRDYMSYCYESNWVSDWTWWETFDRIRALTAFEDAAPPADDPSLGRVLVGVVDGERERWWITRGAVPRATDEGLRLWDGKRSTPLPVARHAMPDGRAQVLLAELPDAVGVDTLSLVNADGRRRAITVDDTHRRRPRG